MASKNSTQGYPRYEKDRNCGHACRMAIATSVPDWTSHNNISNDYVNLETAAEKVGLSGNSVMNTVKPSRSRTSDITRPLVASSSWHARWSTRSVFGQSELVKHLYVRWLRLSALIGCTKTRISCQDC